MLVYGRENEKLSFSFSNPKLRALWKQGWLRDIWGSMVSVAKMWSPHLLVLSLVLSNHTFRFLWYIEPYPAWNPLPRVHDVAWHCGNVENCVVLKVESMLVKLYFVSLNHSLICHDNFSQQKVIIPAFEFSVYFTLKGLTKCFFLREEFETWRHTASWK